MTGGMAEEISILLSADENYARQCAVTVLSVLSNTAVPEKIHIYLLSPDLTDESKERIETVCTRFGARLSVVLVSLSQFKTLPLLHEHFSLSNYSRLLGPDLCTNCDRFLYLDCDLIVLGDVAALFYADLFGMPLGAVPHVSLPYQSVFTSTFPVSDKDRYFNSGAMVIDAVYWREHKVTDEIIKLATAHADKLEFADQDPLNVFFWENYAHLPGDWNVEARLYHERLLGISQDEETQRRMKSPKLIHYTGSNKPWKSKQYVAKRSCYFEYSDRLAALFEWPPKLTIASVRLKEWISLIYTCLYFRISSLKNEICFAG